MRYRHISVAVPVLAERENLQLLVESLSKQTFTEFSLYVCVNNPDDWMGCDDECRRGMYYDNQAALEYLGGIESSFDIHIIDRSSKGRGWVGKKRGVGWARKVLFDAIAAEHDDDELVVSLDADTGFDADYLESVLCALNAHPSHNALSVPYYHPLTGGDSVDRAMLRYEIYMRHYLISLYGVKRNNPSFPYAFSALGSAIVFPLWSYRRVGGITPLQGGEDFYLMQKFAKTGDVLQYCGRFVRPQGRVSSRVPFGTGPAISKGVDSMDDSYPLYPHEAFESVSKTISMFPELYEKDGETPMTEFLCSQLKCKEIWQPLRNNFKTRELFVHACHERVDGLRILQFLKQYREQMVASDGCVLSAEDELRWCCNSHGIRIPDDFSFATSPIDVVNSVRDSLFNLELSMRNYC